MVDGGCPSADLPWEGTIPLTLPRKLKMEKTAKRVTLTFDNGPTPGVTDRVLDILHARRIPAIFFVLGKNLAGPEGRALAARACSEGHSIGNHTYSHSTPLGNNPDAEFARHEIEDTQALIGDLAHPEKYFRPMGGGGVIGPHLLSRAALDLLKAGKYTCVLWSSVPGDWKDQQGWVEKGIAEISSQEWSVVVLHDIQNGCLPRLEEFLDWLDALRIEFRRDFPEDIMVMKHGELLTTTGLWGKIRPA
jgi:peptidoglycan/xylan/chitin deacetylase (PgdA/CDA1 family)